MEEHVSQEQTEVVVGEGKDTHEVSGGQLLESELDTIQAQETDRSQSRGRDTFRNETSPAPFDSKPGVLRIRRKRSGDILDPSNHVKEILVEEKPSVILQYNFFDYILPWESCNTLQGLKDSLKAVFPKDGKIKKTIDDEKFSIESPFTRRTIIPPFWESLGEPGCIVELHGEEVSDKPYNRGNLPPRIPYYGKVGEENGSVTDEEEDEADAGDGYMNKIQFTTRYYMKGNRGDGDDLLHELSEDTPRDLDFQKSSQVAVIQEIQSIIHPRQPGLLHFEVPSFDKRKMARMKPGSTMKPAILRIHSHLLLNALRTVMEYSSILPNDEEQSLQDGSFKYPYPDLYRHKDQLLAFKEGKYACRANHSVDEQKQSDEHIDLLITYLYNQTSIRLAEVEANWAKPKPTTNFASFWLLMKPGETVYARDESGELDAYVLDRIHGGVSRSHLGVSTATSYLLVVWYLDFDGRVVTRYQRKFSVPVFDHEQDILSLPVIPASLQDKADGGKLRGRLTERGKKFFMCSKNPTFMEFTGRGLRRSWKKYNRSRVVVDHTRHPWKDRGMPFLASDHAAEPESLYYDRDDEPRYSRYTSPSRHGLDRLSKPGLTARAPRCECRTCLAVDGDRPIFALERHSEYDNIVSSKTAELTDHQYLVCASHMYAFILKDREYDLISLYGLEKPRLVVNAIDKLVMHAATKDTIKAIVKTYTDGEGQEKMFNADYIHGKGEGQIVLLHGPPGTGKTLTAESVAEFTQRPLVSITAADLGDNPVELETNLLRFFDDANSWDAVVLLDEADVYLERRSTNDLERNSIVSIFLRALEYFQGILFLTTNRVGQFDEAFMSRIHVSIGYTRLDEAARTQIWNNLFNKLKDDHKLGAPEVTYEYEAKEYVRKSTDVKALEWNGREIRNAFQTAVALAFFDARQEDETRGNARGTTMPEIKERHLTQVVNMSAAFRDYIISTHEGLEDSQLAYKLGIRDDLHGTRGEEGRSGGRSGSHRKIGMGRR